MSATTDARPGSSAAARAVQVYPVSLRRVLHSEWIKLRSLRSTVIVLVATVVAVIGIDVAVSAFVNTKFATLSPLDRAPGNIIAHGYIGVYLGQLMIGALGVLAITGEYTSGMIRATLAAVPTRLPVLAAKSTIFAAVAFGVGILASAIAFLAGQATLGGHGVGLGYPGAVRAVFGVALYLMVVGLLGLALGLLIRSTAGGIVALVGVLLVLPALAQVLPSSWQPSVVPYLPANAGQALYNLSHEEPQMHPWAGFALFVGYTLLAMAAAAISLRRRDA